MYSTAVQIVKTLREKGFEAYFAGGAVRDLLLNIPHKDIDIATSARPEEIEMLFSKTYPIGKQFGVILVHEGGYTFEVASFRSDSGASDGRRPEYVTFTTPEEDARRRDFTINGMFYDPLSEKVLDFVHGKADLEARVIRFIGDPLERVREDHLRLLRAVRFAHQIGAQYEPATYAAIRQEAHLIKTVSAERIQQELTKILLFPSRASALEDLQDLGVLQYLLPEVELLKGVAQPLTFHREGSVWDHAMKSIASLAGDDAKDISLLWAVLLHDVGKPQTFSVGERIRYDGHAELSAKMATQILQRLRFPRIETEKISWAIAHHMSLMQLMDPGTSELTRRKRIMHPWFPFLLALHKADVSGTDPADLGLYDEIKRAQEKVRADLPEILPKLISGEELMQQFSLLQGAELGKVIAQIHDWQIIGEVHTKEEVLEKLRKEYFPLNSR